MSPTNAIRILKSKKVTHTLLAYTYDADNLSLDKIAIDNELPIDQIFKTLVVKGDKNGVVVAVIAGSQSLDLKALAKISGNKKMALVPVKDLQGLTGYIRGGCSPIGMKKNFPVYVEQLATDFKKIFVNAGSRGWLMGLDPKDLIQLCGGEFVSIAKS